MRRRAALLLAAALLACGDRDRPPGEIVGGARPSQPPPAASDGSGRRILYGDLHAHTTYSVDAFIYSLPLFGGEGAHPPADACDYARYCSALDFFSITDHAEGLTPTRWRRIVESTRQCNAVANDPADPDLVSFVGWEWTQAGPTPEEHYGHKNVIFPGLADDEIPARPINSLPGGTMRRAPPGVVLEWASGLLGALGQDEYADFLWFIRQMADVPECPEGPSPELPRDCTESAATPAALFEKLRAWGFETLVIPHGLAWGLHAPPGSALDVQLDPANHDPQRQRLLEVSSGHGNSEEYRPWRAVRTGPDGEPVCPEPSDDYLPCCWRAGEIVRERCGDLPAEACEEHVHEARRLALEAGVKARRVLPDTEPEDWLDCGQCRDCFKPAFNLRPRQSAQYALALSRPGGDDGEPLRFRVGFLSSSDDHKAQPGTGYKQESRLRNSDSRGLVSEGLEARLRPYVVGEPEDPRRAQPAPQPRERGFRDLFDVERVASFMYPGGLVAVHAEGRDRRSIWQALERREVFGTSGPRIALWFDLLNGRGGRVPMGGAAALDTVPRFEVRAVGARVQRPGCPDWSVEGLGAERLERLCAGECHHPGDERHAIVAIEVVRVRPQLHPDEDVDALIEDPWLRHECPPDPEGCVLRFEDPEFPASGRDAVYYVRALQEETPAINGANLRTRFDAQGRPASVEPCYGGWRTPADDDCLAPVHERAWSSPIFVDRAPPEGERALASAP